MEGACAERGQGRAGARGRGKEERGQGGGRVPEDLKGLWDRSLPPPDAAPLQAGGAQVSLAFHFPRHSLRALCVLGTLLGTPGVLDKAARGQGESMGGVWL